METVSYFIDLDTEAWDGEESCLRPPMDIHLGAAFDWYNLEHKRREEDRGDSNLLNTYYVLGACIFSHLSYLLDSGQQLWGRGGQGH